MEDALRVEAIEKIQAGMVLYRIRLENEETFTVHSGTLKRLGIKTGVVISCLTFPAEVKASEIAEGREATLRTLAFRGRTTQELTRILESKGFESHVVAEAVAWASGNGLLEEAQLLEDSAEALMRKKGVRSVRRQLLDRGFSREAVEHTLKEIEITDEHYENLLKKACKKKSQLEDRYPKDWSQRLGAWLFAQGHNMDTIKKVLRDVKSTEQ